MSTVIVWVLVVLIQPGTMAASTVVVDNIVSQEACKKAYDSMFRPAFYRDEGTLVASCTAVEKAVIK